MATLYHQVWINAPIARLCAAIATVEGVESWWGQQTAVQTEDGLVLEHNPGPMHGVVRLKVLETVPDTRVEWTCISRHPEASPASAWTGTHLHFAIAERGNIAAMSGFGRDGDRVAVLDFRHSGWDAGSPFLGFCNFAWGQVLNALKGACEAP